MSSIMNILRLALCVHGARAISTLTVETTSGPVTGLINGTTPNVAQFLGIPFAEPPVGERRWLPSVAKSRDGHIDATRFGLGCPQFQGNGSSVWATDAPQFNTPANTTGEDCLSVNIWAPWQHNGTEGLPVIAWIYGGAFQTGAGNIEYQNPSQWIERSQKHIVVGINYRLNIFGFPNAAGLQDDEQNLGLLDQRLGLEWIRDNIASFGGDPARITLWGQSAGAMSVDYYNFAYPTDPIVHGLIMDSGNALLQLGSNDEKHTNFTFVSNHFECGNLSASSEIDCMRNVSSTAIISYLKSYSDTKATPALSFNPIVDNRTKFANYTARALAKDFTQVPAIAGTTSMEGVAFAPYPNPPSAAPNITIANTATLDLFLCPTVKTTHNRHAVSAMTFRYHSSELPLIFGTSGIARGESTPFELEVSRKMQDFWLAFAEDPVDGLPKMGWEAYTPENDAVLIGYDGAVTQPIAESKVEAACDGAAGKPGASPPS